MKNPYKKGKRIHPLSSPPSTPSSSQYYLSLLPATLFSLTTSLSADDIQVLTYLIYCSNNTNIAIDHSHAKHRKAKTDEHKDQQPLFECNCFWCYTRFWAKWDMSPNREVIEEIIEGYEEGLAGRKNVQSGRNTKKGRKKGSQVMEEKEKGVGEFDVVEESGGDAGEVVEEEAAGAVAVDGGEEGEVCSAEKGGVRTVMNLIGEKIWGLWNRM